MLAVVDACIPSWGRDGLAAGPARASDAGSGGTGVGERWGLCHVSRGAMACVDVERRRLRGYLAGRCESLPWGAA
jgi:hypothetical protein